MDTIKVNVPKVKVVAVTASERRAILERRFQFASGVLEGLEDKECQDEKEIVAAVELWAKVTHELVELERLLRT